MLSISEYQKLIGGDANTVELLADNKGAAIDVDVPPLQASSLQIPELPTG